MAPMQSNGAGNTICVRLRVLGCSRLKKLSFRTVDPYVKVHINQAGPTVGSHGPAWPGRFDTAAPRQLRPDCDSETLEHLISSKQRSGSQPKPSAKKAATPARKPTTRTWPAYQPTGFGVESGGSREDANARGQ